ALDWHEAGHPVALVTVMETWGSAPRPPGSQMAVRGDGLFAGSVSGGCVEAAVIAEAIAALAEGQARLLGYGVSDQDAFAAGLSCGGQIRLLVEPVGTVLPPDLLSGLAKARQQRRNMVYIVDLASGSRRVQAAEDLWGDPIPGAYCAMDGARFISLYLPPPRLILVGAVQIAQALLPMAAALSYEVILIDPRYGFLTEARFPYVQRCADWPDRALPALGLDVRTALVTLSHEARIDDPALILALSSAAAYVGALGARKTQAARLERLRAAGVGAEGLARLKAPVGLAIGAATPAEIALSILAEIVATFRRSEPPKQV
ncbi:MAG: XdhC family protein, partial [Rhodobacteraceae bacterium]|nr:XdhC family protein [Paracoccaceae bacterium]